MTRAERCIGLAIRKGQAEGTIAKRGREKGAVGTISSPTPLVGENQERRDTYAMTDNVSDSDFESALSEAKGRT